ncbi:hypothetical protein PHMEG_00017555 [Phytophthora megakarya]|uniref:Uncharacterized protein n=1 Tax=Phytophthora megakarya TaxID=4795 RepID=A0A225VWJ0_9STRA|nr:hypothetical protein PHMEG_00017555 [Phytophthora megakarya]
MRTDEVAWYPGIEACSANFADPHVTLQVHGVPTTGYTMQITQRAGSRGKFFNVAVLNRNAPPLRPQP